jgi:hypothetical protein
MLPDKVAPNPLRIRGLASWRRLFGGGAPTLARRECSFQSRENPSDFRMKKQMLAGLAFGARVIAPPVRRRRDDPRRLVEGRIAYSSPPPPPSSLRKRKTHRLPGTKERQPTNARRQRTRPETPDGPEVGDGEEGAHFRRSLEGDEGVEEDEGDCRRWKGRSGSVGEREEMGVLTEGAGRS